MGWLKTVAALLSTLAAISASVRSGLREASVEGIQEAVLLDLLEDNRWGFSGHPNPVPGDRVVCVSVWRTKDLFVAKAEADPSTATLERLRALGREVVPGSTCNLSWDEMSLQHAGREAVLIGVGMPNWVDSEFVKIEGAWYLGPLYAAGSRYTVSLTNGAWVVDTVAFTWVAEVEEGRRTGDRADEAGCQT